MFVIFSKYLNQFYTVVLKGFYIIYQFAFATYLFLQNYWNILS